MREKQMDWLAEGEKYALVGLRVKVAKDVPTGLIAPSLWVVNGAHFQLPSHWREWLGTIHAEEVEAANLLLLSKIKSERPGVLDGENKPLSHFVSLFYVGLLLTSGFSTSHKPFLLTGSVHNGDMDMREHSNFEVPIPCAFRRYPALTAEDVQTGARIAGKIKAIEDDPLPDGHWRFFRVFISTKKRVRCTISLIGSINIHAALMD